MLWLLTLGTFVLWFVAVLADAGGDFVDILLVVPAVLLILQLWPRRKPAESRSAQEPPLLAVAPPAEPQLLTVGPAADAEISSVETLTRAA